MKGSKAMKRAAKTKQNFRLDGTVPLITDTTELVTPEMADEILKKNENNRDVNWTQVKKYQKMMEAGEWKLHAQGIIIDSNGNLQTGQTRLWAIKLCGQAQLLRISKGSPPESAKFIDRGKPQTPRDLATRETRRKHSPYEVSMVRALLALEGTVKPDYDTLADKIVEKNLWLKEAMKQMRRVKKTPEIYMILGVLCQVNDTSLFGKVKYLGRLLNKELYPILIEECWNKGAAFTLAMEKAKDICREEGIGG